jgi:ribosome biogenesis GTPase
MRLEDFGYNDKLENYRIENNLESFEIGRVIAEHKERYVVRTIKGEFEAEIPGNMRFTAESRENFPAVGDWVAITTYDYDFAIIHSILPRFSIIKRQEVGIADTANGLEITFEAIVSLSKNCKFTDCTHTNEVGCCVVEAV